MNNNKIVVVAFFPSFLLAASGTVVSVGAFLFGEDELVCSVASGGEEDLDITALMEAQSLACRPTSIISFNSDCGSEAALASHSQPISIVTDTALDGAVEDYNMLPGPATTSGVKEVVAMAEVSASVLLFINSSLNHLRASCVP